MEIKPTNDLSSRFLALIDLIRCLVCESKNKNEFPASPNTMQRWKVLGHQKTDTGITVSQSQIQYFDKPDWHKGVFAIEKRIRESTQYKSFIDQMKLEIAEKNGNEVARSDFSQPIFRIIEREFSGKS